MRELYFVIIKLTKVPLARVKEDMSSRAKDLRGQINQHAHFIHIYLNQNGIDNETTRLEGFEPPTPGTGILCSIQLSYRRILLQYV